MKEGGGGVGGGRKGGRVSLHENYMLSHHLLVVDRFMNSLSPPPGFPSFHPSFEHYIDAT